LKKRADIDEKRRLEKEEAAKAEKAE